MNVLSMLLRHIPPKYHGNIILKKAIFKVLSPSSSTDLISSPHRFTVPFPGQDRRQEVPQGSFTMDFHQVVVPSNVLQNLRINSTI